MHRRTFELSNATDTAAMAELATPISYSTMPAAVVIAITPARNGRPTLCPDTT
jgi:hypothetical protein